MQGWCSLAQLCRWRWLQRFRLSKAGASLVADSGSSMGVRLQSCCLCIADSCTGTCLRALAGPRKRVRVW